MSIEILEKEVDWCEKNSGLSGKGKEFEKAFVAGLKQAIYLISISGIQNNNNGYKYAFNGAMEGWRKESEALRTQLAERDTRVAELEKAVVIAHECVNDMAYQAHNNVDQPNDKCIVEIKRIWNEYPINQVGELVDRVVQKANRNESEKK